MACLAAKGGVSATVLEQEVVRQCQSSTFLWAIVGTNFDRLRGLYHSAPLQPFALLWLSVQKVTRPQLFSHSVLASILTSMLVLKQSESLVDAHRALVAGLLHDCGDPYGNPGYADLGTSVSRGQWMEIMAHAKTGSELVEQFTDYSESISEAVRQHHEKLDGSGYPSGLSEQSLSPLGSVLSLVETVCGVMNAPNNHAARAKLALSFVAGEYDPQVVSLLMPPVSGMFATGIVLPADFNLVQAIERSELMSRRLKQAHQTIARYKPSDFDNEQMAAVMEFAQRRVARLKSSWEATGIGEYFADEAARLSQSAGNEKLFFDLDVVPRELIWRMRSLARMIVMMLHQRCLSGNSPLDTVIAALDVES
ncbi:MAG: HD-GYP domain-containing protein [Rhodoferax sp.]